MRKSPSGSRAGKLPSASRCATTTVFEPGRAECITSPWRKVKLALPSSVSTLSSSWPPSQKCMTRELDTDTPSLKTKVPW